jgi:hypothetical protein
MAAGPPKPFVSAFGIACPKVACFWESFYLFVTFKLTFGWKEENIRLTGINHQAFWLTGSGCTGIVCKKLGEK